MRKSLVMMSHMHTRRIKINNVKWNKQFYKTKNNLNHKIKAYLSKKLFVERKLKVRQTFAIFVWISCYLNHLGEKFKHLFIHFITIHFHKTDSNKRKIIAVKCKTDITWCALGFPGFFHCNAIIFSLSYERASRSLCRTVETIIIRLRESNEFINIAGLNHTTLHEAELTAIFSTVRLACAWEFARKKEKINATVENNIRSCGRARALVKFLCGRVSCHILESGFF